MMIRVIDPATDQPVVNLGGNSTTFVEVVKVQVVWIVRGKVKEKLNKINGRISWLFWFVQYFCFCYYFDIFIQCFFNLEIYLAVSRRW
jgi:hypothetical protein